MAARTDLSRSQARRMAVAAQGLGGHRPAGAVTRAQVRAAIDRIGIVQLDAINVVQRTQFLVLFSRLGAFDPNHLHGLTGPGRHLFEYWGHMASVQPSVQHPLFRWRMALPSPYGDSPGSTRMAAAFRAEHGGYMDAVLAEVRDRGPLAAGQLEDPRRRDGEWWGRRGVGRQALEWLFAGGDLAGWRSPNFERVYDIPERVLPAEVLAAPTPPIEEAHRRLLVIAASALGVGTVADLADYHRIGTTRARPRVQELVDGGLLDRVEVEGWREPGYVLPGARVPTIRRTHATLLSPFDSLIWYRDRAARLFDYDFRIEVYTPEAKRTYGYYVLSLLLGTDIVGRFDVKADRKAGALLVRGSFLEPGHDAATVADAAARELEAMAAWLGLGRLEVADRGDLAPALRRVVPAAPA